MAGTMKIGTTAQAYASATFTFPNNPTVVNIPFANNMSIAEIPYAKTHIYLGGGGVATRRIVLTGTLFGADKLTNLNKLLGYCDDNTVRRFWISATRFFNVIGRQCSHTYQGTKTNFIDYVMAIDCITPYALAGTASTYTVPLTNDSKTTLNDATTSSTGAFTNAGNAPAFVQWSIENAAGSNITKIEIGDTSDYDSSPHKIEWTGALASGSTLLISIFGYTATGTRGTMKELRLAYPTVSGTKTGNIRVLGDAIPWIDAAGADQAFSIKLTGNDNTANITATWNSSYTG